MTKRKVNSTTGKVQGFDEITQADADSSCYDRKGDVRNMSY